VSPGNEYTEIMMVSSRVEKEKEAIFVSDDLRHKTVVLFQPESSSGRCYFVKSAENLM
jgi:hypothetical protein